MYSLLIYCQFFFLLSFEIGIYGALTSTEQTYLVNYFNAIRSQAGASDMFTVEWDTTIAAEAQNRVNTCTGTCQPAMTNYQLMQSQATSNIATIKLLTELWYNGTEVYNYEGNNCTGGVQWRCNLYKAITYANAYQLGCGKATRGDYEMLICYQGPILGSYNSRPYTLATSTQPECSLCHGACVGGMCVRSNVCLPGGIEVSGGTIRPELNGIYNLGFCADDSREFGSHPQYVKDNYWYLYYEEYDVGQWQIGLEKKDSSKPYNKIMYAHWATANWPYYSHCESRPWKVCINNDCNSDSQMMVKSCGGTPEGKCSDFQTPCEESCGYRTDWIENCAPTSPSGGSPTASGNTGGASTPPSAATSGQSLSPSMSPNNSDCSRLYSFMPVFICLWQLFY